jgi:hypothetical protein
MPPLPAKKLSLRQGDEDNEVVQGGNDKGEQTTPTPTSTRPCTQRKPRRHKCTVQPARSRPFRKLGQGGWPRRVTSGNDWLRDCNSGPWFGARGSWRALSRAAVGG